MKDNRTSVVRGFEINDEFYSHVIDLSDDAIRLYDENRSLILTYDSNAVARDVEGKLVGTFSIKGDYDTGIWQFKFSEDFGNAVVDGERCRLAEGLLDSEVTVSREFLLIVKGKYGD